MSQNSVRTALAVLFCASALLVPTGSVSAGNPRLVVRIYDTSDGAADIRAAAIHAAAVSFRVRASRRSGATARTTAPRLAVRTSPGRRDLIVRIMPEVTPGSTFRRSSLQLHTRSGEIRLPLGIAVIDPITLAGEMATIFHEQVRTVARQSGVDDAELLGRVVAHEIGHLLLKANTHSRNGLMRGVWSIAELQQDRARTGCSRPAIGCGCKTAQLRSRRHGDHTAHPIRLTPFCATWTAEDCTLPPAPSQSSARSRRGRSSRRRRWFFGVVSWLRTMARCNWMRRPRQSMTPH